MRFGKFCLGGLGVVEAEHRHTQNSELQPTDLGAPLGAILLRTAKLAPGNSLAARAARWLAIAPVAESVPAIGPAEVEQIA
jgi:hypothetical protein